LATTTISSLTTTHPKLEVLTIVLAVGDCGLLLPLGACEGPAYCAVGVHIGVDGVQFCPPPNSANPSFARFAHPIRQLIQSCPVDALRDADAPLPRGWMYSGLFRSAVAPGERTPAGRTAEQGEQLPSPPSRCAGGATQI
jgi:hypothetical protein